MTIQHETAAAADFPAAAESALRRPRRDAALMRAVRG